MGGAVRRGRALRGGPHCGGHVRPRAGAGRGHGGHVRAPHARVVPRLHAADPVRPHAWAGAVCGADPGAAHEDGGRLERSVISTTARSAKVLVLLEPRNPLRLTFDPPPPAALPPT